MNITVSITIGDVSYSIAIYPFVWHYFGAASYTYPTHTSAFWIGPVCLSANSAVVGRGS
jgi:hypothetical protein